MENTTEKAALLKRIAELEKESSDHLDLVNVFSQAFIAERNEKEKERAEKEKLKKELAERSVDPLTGLISSTTIIDDEINMLSALTYRSQEILVLFFLDINNFKYINDTYGHHAGDETILQTSVTIGACLRESDLMTRRGNKSDEFVLAIVFEKGELRKKIRAFIKRLQWRVKGKEIHIDDRNKVSVSVAVGFAVRRRTRHTLLRDLKVADMRMIRNKKKMKSN